METRLGLSEGLDTQVQGTNDDAQISKLSCSNAGYFKDSYVQYFVRKPMRRSPLINRGYYSRYAGLRRLLLQFLDTAARQGQAAQVLVLGAGYDTTWFQLAELGLTPNNYLELDFKLVEMLFRGLKAEAGGPAREQMPSVFELDVTQRKVAIMQQQPVLWNQLTAAHKQHHPSSSATEAAESDSSQAPTTAQTADAATGNQPSAPQGSAIVTEPNQPPQTTNSMPPPPSIPPSALRLGAPRSGLGGGSARSPLPVPEGMHFNAAAGEMLSATYSVLPVDLRDTTALQNAIQRAGLDKTLPTYILSECVMVYMESDASNQLLKWLSSYFQRAAVVIYEQIKPDDAFGRQMMSNLESRGCPLRGLPATPTLQDHCKRLAACGWPVARAWDMDSVYKWHLDPEDKARVERLEVFDEFEEWHLIQEHYSISVGIKEEGGVGEGSQGLSVLLRALTFGDQGQVSASLS